MTEHFRTHSFFIPESELTFSLSRSSGPGGQNVNKVETRVTVSWNVDRSAIITEEQKSRVKEKLKNRIVSSGELILHCGMYRSQLRNKEEVIRRLTDLVREALVERPKRKRTKPPRYAREQRLKTKREHAEKKESRKLTSLHE